MEASYKAIKLIKDSESCRLNAYADPAKGWAVPTIGWGSTGPDIKRGTVWTQKQADGRLLQDVSKVSAQVTEVLAGSPTTQNQFDAMVDFTYNLGIGNLRSSTLLRKHKAGDYKGAAAEFKRWNHSAGRVRAGLTTRRLKEAELYAA